MRIAVVNYAYDESIREPDQLLDRYSTLTGWSDAIAAAGCVVAVAQRFHKDARIVRQSCEYVFCEDGARGDPRTKLWPHRLHRRVKDLRPDLVHVNGLNVPIQTWLLRRSLPSSIPIVVQDHGGIESPRRDFVRRLAMQAPDAFFFTAAAQASRWREAGLIAVNQPVHQVLEASTGIRSVDRTAARRATGIEGDPAVLWVGRLNANKDPLTVLEGFEIAIAHLPNARLTMIYGTADLLPAVRERIAGSTALAGRVTLAGAVAHERMSDFYSAADLFILASHHEGSGYALLEACACGLSPVVTDIPAFRAITGDGAIGALWPNGNARACAEALITASARERSAARQAVLDHFDRALSWPAIARQASEAYAGILAAVVAGAG